MVNGVVAQLAMDSGWSGELQEISEVTVDRGVVSDGFHARDV
jgi:hypothetical protein